MQWYSGIYTSNMTSVRKRTVQFWNGLDMENAGIWSPVPDEIQSNRLDTSRRITILVRFRARGYTDNFHGSRKRDKCSCASSARPFARELLKMFAGVPLHRARNINPQGDT